MTESRIKHMPPLIDSKALGDAVESRQTIKIHRYNAIHAQWLRHNHQLYPAKGVSQRHLFSLFSS